MLGADDVPPPRAANEDLLAPAVDLLVVIPGGFGSQAAVGGAPTQLPRQGLAFPEQAVDPLVHVNVLCVCVCLCFGGVRGFIYTLGGCGWRVVVRGNGFGYL